LIGIRESEAATLAYFRNNALHLFALPSLIACLLSNNHQLDAARITSAVSGIYGLMKSELFLRWQAEELPAATAAIIEVLVGRGLLQRTESGQLAAPEANSEAFSELRLLGETIRPMLERHFLTLAVLQHGGSSCQTRHTLETNCHLLAQRLTLLYASTSEHSEISTFSALIAHLIDADLISEDPSGFLHFDQRLITPLEHAELVLAAEARQTIRRMARTGLPEFRSGV
jgi:glycerol-3-phosphate O-acyltransferase